MLRRPNPGPHRPHRHNPTQTLSIKLHIRRQPTIRKRLAHNRPSSLASSTRRQRPTLIHVATRKWNTNSELFQGQVRQSTILFGEVFDELGRGGGCEECKWGIFQAA